MAVRYVKDFEFPAASGYTKSATPVTGQMLAKGGPAKGGPKGVMVVIGVGKPMKKADGGSVSDADRLNQMFADAAAANDAERTMSGKSKAPPAKKAVPVAKRGSPYVPGTNIRADEIYSKEAQDRLTRGYKKGGPAKHDDAAMDKALIKKMVSPEAIVGKKAGGMAQKVQMAKSNAIAASLKGQKKTGYADGGMMMGAPPVRGISLPAPVAPGGPGNRPGMDRNKMREMASRAQDMMANRPRPAGPGRKVPSPMPTPLPMPAPMARKSGGKVMKKAAGGAAISPQMDVQGPPLQSMPAAVRAPAMGRARAPAIVAEPSTARVAVNAKRPGGPNVGKLRARMAKAASMANPDSAPAMMKKGGKTNC